MVVAADFDYPAGDGIAIAAEQFGNRAIYLSAVLR